VVDRDGERCIARLVRCSSWPASPRRRLSMGASSRQLADRLSSA